MLPSNMLLLDYETNGAQFPGTNKMDLMAQLPVEVCALRVIDGEVTAVFNALVYYAGEWTPALENGHHTSDELMKGMSEAAVAWAMSAMLHDNPVIVAYNALFDVSVTYNMLNRYGLDRAAGHLFSSMSILDPLTICRDRYSGSHKMVDACAHYGIALPGAHMAYDDVMGMFELLKALDAEADVMPYINVVGYNRQYSPPEWVPKMVTLKPQGSETFYHQPDGTVKQQTNTGRPFQPQVMGKPIRPEPQAPRSVDDMQYDVVMGLRNAILEDMDATAKKALGVGLRNAILEDTDATAKKALGIKPNLIKDALAASTRPRPVTPKP
jgi:hypothetical protein